MLSDLVDIIVKIAEGIKRNFPLDQMAKSFELEKKYNKNMIAMAYSWIYEKTIRDLKLKNKFEIPDSGLRIFSVEEINLVGLENINYLMHFYNIGLINKFDLELIFEHLVILPEELIDYNYINILLLSLFLNLDNFLLPGSRLLLYSSDTVN
jgi:uncharacterized protein Smg (DUF494 family)